MLARLTHVNQLRVSGGKIASTRRRTSAGVKPSKGAAMFKKVTLIALILGLAANAANAIDFRTNIAASFGADYFSESTGWQTLEQEWYGRMGTASPPSGSWALDYKHWFGSSPPPAWSTYESVAKPSKKDWRSTPTIDKDHQTTAPSGSYGRSEWQIGFPTALCTNYCVSYGVRSTANASDITGAAYSRSRIKDPWVMRSPQLDPTWDTTAQPLDPEGKWELSGNVSFFGSVTGGGSASAEYKIALNSSNEADARTFLKMEVSGTDVSLTTPELPDGFSLLFYRGNQSAAVLTTADELEQSLRSHLGPNGWGLAPGMPFNAIDPGSESYLNQVFNVFPVFRFGPQVRTATIFTAREVFVPSLAVPEPALAWLLVAGMSIVGLASRSRISPRPTLPTTKVAL